MVVRASANSIEGKLSSLATAMESLRARSSAAVAPAIERFSADLAATRFHFTRDVTKRTPMILAVLGGTGTGKSTIVNRLLDAEASPLTAASFRRTFTAGPVAIVHESNRLPERWLNIDHASIDRAHVPARGRADALS